MQKLSRWILAAVASLLLAGQAGAVGFNLSDLSSDSTPVSQLAALLDFQVSGSTLSVNVRNRTSAATPFDIAGVFMNASPDVIGLTYTGAREGSSTAWTLFNSGTAVTNWKFGTFDFALIGSISSDAGQIVHGYSNLFSFGIQCRSGAVCDVNDFLGTLSTGGQLAALAGLRFVEGPAGDGAFGGGTQVAPVPEPSTALLLALGLVGFARARSGRRR